MSDYEQMLKTLHERDPHNRDIQYAVAALIRADRDGTEQLAVSLAQQSRHHLAADIAAELRWHPSPQVRARAWSGTGAQASGEEWDRALAVETDSDILGVMRMVAPVADFPDARVWALLGAKREKFTVASARNLVQDVGRAAGAESWWAAALAALNPNTLPKSTLEDIAASLTLGYATTEVLSAPDVPWLYRVFAALAPNVPDGTLSALAAEGPATGVKLREDASAVLHRALYDAAAGSMTDRAGIRELSDSSEAVVNRARTKRHWAFDAVAGLAPEATYRHLLDAATKAADASPGQRDGIALRLWRSLPVTERTDAVCAHTLVTFAHSQTLCLEVLDFLGERAAQVLDDDALTATLARFTSPEPAWWLHTAAPRAWVHRVRHRNSWGDATRYRHTNALQEHQHLRDLVWNDLVSNPEEWDERAAAIVVNELADIGALSDEQWLQLPTPVLTAVVNMNGPGAHAAFPVISAALARTVAAPTSYPAGDPAGDRADGAVTRGGVTSVDVARTTALRHLCGPTITLGSALSASAAVA